MTAPDRRWELVSEIESILECLWLPTEQEHELTLADIDAVQTEVETALGGYRERIQARAPKRARRARR